MWRRIVREDCESGLWKRTVRDLLVQREQTEDGPKTAQWDNTGVRLVTHCLTLYWPTVHGRLDVSETARML